MAGSRPLWRRAFDEVEGRVGRVAEATVGTEAFADVVALAIRTQRGLQRQVERRTRSALHTANLPTATDVRRISDQVASLQRELRRLQRELELREASGDGTPPRRRRAARG